MKPIHFQSSLADKFEKFVRLRQAAGRDYEAQAYLLSRFDRFLVENKYSELRITQKMTEGYQKTLSHLSRGSQYNRFCVVRQVCEYIALDDPKSYIPHPLRHIGSDQGQVPYIYSQEELKSLLKAAEALPSANSLFPYTCKTFLGLLATTGVRVGEALAFNLGDFCSRREALHIREGKFGKARWLPLSSSTTQALTAYFKRRAQLPGGKDAPLFLNRKGERLTHSIYYTFRRLLEMCDIRHRPGFGPRLHDFRHSFAVNRLLLWYREGIDINSRLPALATYMGHADMRGTQVYLKATPQLIEQVDQRFRTFFLNNVNKKDSSS